MVEPQPEKGGWNCLDGLIKPASANEVLKSLMANEAMTTEELVRVTRLSKSQVASGLRTLRWRGWVSSSESESARPGRSPHLWSLSLSRDKIIQTLVNELNATSHLLNDALRSLAKVLRSD